MKLIIQIMRKNAYNYSQSIYVEKEVYWFTMLNAKNHVYSDD